MEEQLPSTSKIQESGTAISINRRMKRKSSDDCLEMQKKVFVNEKKANSSDDKKMKEIFEKTVAKLFIGSQKCFAKLDQNENESSDANNNDSHTISSAYSETTKTGPRDLKNCCCCYKIMIIPYGCFLCKRFVCGDCFEICAKCGNSQCRKCFQFVTNVEFASFDIDVPLCRVCDL